MDLTASNQNELHEDKDEDKILSLDHLQTTPSQTAPQYRQNSNSTGRMRRNGSMRRSLLFVSGSGMQLTSPNGSGSSNNNSPYHNTGLSHSLDMLSTINDKGSRQFSRDRAKSYGNESLLKAQRSPEHSVVKNSEETNHPLIVTKNSFENPNRVFTPTPARLSSIDSKQEIDVSTNAKSQLKRSGSLSKRSLLVTPSSVQGTMVSPSGNFTRGDETDDQVENGDSQGLTGLDSPVENPTSVKKAPLPAIPHLEDNSSEFLTQLALKEAKILETKSELEDLKKLVKLKEEQLREEQKQLEEVKQEMALKLLKSHKKITDETSSGSNNRLQFNNVSESMTNIIDKTRKSAQSFVANVNTSVEQKQNADDTANFMNTTFEDDLQFPSNDFDENESLHDVIYSLNSPIKKAAADTIKEESQIEQDPLDLNFKPKSETAVHQSLQATASTNNPKSHQRSKSRMSMYFSKTVSLMSQFDQMLQSELEKKMGINEEDEQEEDQNAEDPDEIIYDLPIKSQETEPISTNGSVKKQHSRSLSSYRFFG